MAVETAADRAAMLAADDFGLTATINFGTLVGIFDHEYIEVGGMASRHPTFHCDETVAIAAGAEVGVKMVIDEVNYIIRDMQPDGTGMTVLILEEEEDP